MTDMPDRIWVDFEMEGMVYTRPPATNYLRGVTAEYVRADLAPIAALAMREAVSEKARSWAAIYDPGTDERNTFTLFAEWVNDTFAPSEDEILAAALRVPKIAALVEAATEVEKSYIHLRALGAALAALESKP